MKLLFEYCNDVKIIIKQKKKLKRKYVRLESKVTNYLICSLNW